MNVMTARPVALSVPSSGRDLRIRNYGFSDAAEIFVFISGCTAVICLQPHNDARRLVESRSAIYRRVWQLYVAHILLFVFSAGQIADRGDAAKRRYRTARADTGLTRLAVAMQCS
jgi:hypothetical protein